jgi:hypothetical protein
MGVFIGFKNSNTIWGCKHPCHLDGSYKKIDQILRSFVKEKSFDSAKDIFNNIEWIPYDEEKNVTNGSILLSLIKNESLEKYKKDLENTINSLKKGQQYIGLEPGSISDSLYEEELERYFQKKGDAEKVVLSNNPQSNKKNSVVKSYIFDLDDKKLRIEDKINASEEVFWFNMANK